MTILIGKYEFDGPFKGVSELEEKPGLFAILHCEQEEYELIHLAESDNVKERIELSPTTDHSANGSIVIIALYTQTMSGRERRKMVLEIESELDCVHEDSEASRIVPDFASAAR
jgi:hypothetical protein